MMKRTAIWMSLLAVSAIARAEPQLAEQEADKAYAKARTCYQNLMLNEPSQAQRGNWERCMTQFAVIARDYNETAKAPDALFTLAKMYRLLSQQSHNKEDAKEAYARFDAFTDRYKKSRLYDDALFEMACIKLYTFDDEAKAKRLLLQIIRWDPDGDRVGDAKNLLAKIKSGNVKAADVVPLKPQGAVLQNKPKPLDTTAGIVPPAAAATHKPATTGAAEKKSPKP